MQEREKKTDTHAYSKDRKQKTNDKDDTHARQMFTDNNKIHTNTMSIWLLNNWMIDEACCQYETKRSEMTKTKRVT